jgi:acyl dehydratase
MTKRSYADMTNMIGQPLGASGWKTIDQDMVNQFAECTGDRQWIHIDVERAKRESPFGGPVAHGHLTLSLCASLSQDIGVAPAHTASVINYGFDKVRFLAPVLVGALVRLHMKVAAFDQKGPGQYLMKSQSTLEIEGGAKPALIATSLAMMIAEPGTTEETA